MSSAKKSAQKQAAARKQKKDRGFIGIIAVVLVAGLAVIGYMMSNPSRPTPQIVDPNAPPLTAKGYVMGSDSAAVEIVEYGDFECPVCGQFATITEPDVRDRLVKTGIARFRFIDWPMPDIHPNAMIAHNAAACADAQGKFWEMHDKLFAGQTVWSAVLRGSRASNPGRVFRDYAKEIGLDGAAFETCLDTRPHEAQILANKASGSSRGVSGTPNFFVGKRMYPGIAPYDILKAYVDSALADAKAKTP